MWLILAWLALNTSPDLDSGIELRQEGKLEEAIEVFGQILAEHPHSLEARRELGHSLVLTGRYRDGIDSYTKLAEARSLRWHLEAAKWSARAHLYLGEFDTALNEMGHEAQIAGQLSDGGAKVHATWYRGHVLSNLDRFEEANSAFLAALGLYSDDLNTLHQVGVMAAREGDWGSLRYQIPDLEQVIHRSGDPSQMRRVYHLKAELALHQGNPQDALTLLDQANGLFPHPLYQEAMARAYRAQENYSDAERTYRTIVEATDERLDIPVYYVKALLGLAEVLDAQGRRGEAAAYYQRFLDHWGDAPGPPPGVARAKKNLQEVQALP